MSVERTAARLAALYPRRWRARYGPELQTLIVEMSDGRRIGWRVWANVAAAGGREWLRSGVSTGGSPRDRARAGVALVAPAWALFIVAGVIVQKSSEHWQDALGGAHPVAGAAFTALIAGALLCGLVVLSGIALTVPTLFRFLRNGGGARIRRPILIAAVLSALWVAGGVAVIAWAHSLSAHTRSGGDTGYAVVWVAWGLMGAAALGGWTWAAVRTASHLKLPDPVLRLQARLAVAAGALMTVMTLATAVWWAAVASASPAALSGSVGGGGDAVRPELILAMILMIAGLGLAATGGRRAADALGRFTDLP